MCCTSNKSKCRSPKKSNRVEMKARAKRSQKTSKNNCDLLYYKCQKRLLKLGSSTSFKGDMNIFIVAEMVKNLGHTLHQFFFKLWDLGQRIVHQPVLLGEEWPPVVTYHTAAEDGSIGVRGLRRTHSRTSVSLPNSTQFFRLLVGPLVIQHRAKFIQLTN